MFGPVPVTSATFPSSDTSNGYPSRALTDLARYPLISTRNGVLAWRIRPLWRIWYPLGSRILHVGHFLQDLFGLVAPVALVYHGSQALPAHSDEREHVRLHANATSSSPGRSRQRVPVEPGAGHSARPGQCGAGHKNSSGVTAHDI